MRPEVSISQQRPFFPGDVNLWDRALSKLWCRKVLGVRLWNRRLTRTFSGIPFREQQRSLPSCWSIKYTVLNKLYYYCLSCTHTDIETALHGMNLVHSVQDYYKCHCPFNEKTRSNHAKIWWSLRNAKRPMKTFSLPKVEVSRCEGQRIKILFLMAVYYYNPWILLNTMGEKRILKYEFCIFAQQQQRWIDKKRELANPHLHDKKSL